MVSVFGFGPPKSLFLHPKTAISEIETICEGTIQILLTLMSCCRKLNVFVLLVLFFLQIYCGENKYYSPSKSQNMSIYSSSCCFSRSMCICQTGLRVCGSSIKSLPRASLYNAIPSFWPSIVYCSHVDVAIHGEARRLFIALLLKIRHTKYQSRCSYEFCPSRILHYFPFSVCVYVCPSQA